MEPSPAGASISFSAADVPHQRIVRKRRHHSSIILPRKSNMVGHWAPTSKSPAFGAWFARLLAWLVRIRCASPITIQLSLS